MLKQTIALACVLILGLAVAALAGCSTPAPVATPTVTRTPMPSATATPALPTATHTPAATPTPSATPTPETVEMTPPPPDVNPLTGLKVDDVAVLDRIPLAIKVSNSVEARPQSGLGSADLVFEHRTEARITRFTAIFYTNEPEVVGSVRSGREIDVEIPAMYHALFAYSGSSAGVKELLRNSDQFPDYIAAPDFGVGQPYFYRVPQQGKAFEHTLFASPSALRELADERGINARPEWNNYMAFSDAVPASGEQVTSFDVDYQSASSAEWDYDTASGVWNRSINGSPHVDALTGKQITASNVIVVYANHLHSNFWEQMIGDQSSWLLSVQIQLWGQGPAVVFRDGEMFPGIWKREARGDVLTFYYGDETPLPIKPGNSWIQVVPLSTTSEQTGEGHITFEPPNLD